MIFEIERYAIHDGPGIRTMIFFKGCPLACKWCCNPESQDFRPQLVYWRTKCLGCLRCLTVCPTGALSHSADGGVSIDRSRCTVCGQCAQECYAEALCVVGREVNAHTVLDEILRDEHFYRNSGGGVTFSGGEALSQPDFLAELAGLCKRHGLHTSLETCGYAPWETFLHISPQIDLFLYDLKHLDAQRHQELTGVSNERIIDNFQRLIDSGKQVQARVPILPGINDSDADLERLIGFLKHHAPGIRIDLLPYHRLGVTKYHRLNMPYELEALEPLPEETIQQIKHILTNQGFVVSIGGQL